MSDNNERKRARSSNFSNEEKIELLNLVVKYKNVIENKKTDKVSTKEKNEAWETISQEFNAKSPDGSYRSAESLKKFYENKKKEVRKAAARENIEIKKTGGGVFPKIKTDPLYDLVLSVINTKTVYGVENEFDCDGDDICAAEITENNAGPSTETPTTFELDRNDEYQVILDSNESAIDFEAINLQLEKKKINTEKNLCNQSKEKVTPESTINTHKNWANITPVALQTPKSVQLQRKLRDPARRRPATVVKALTTSEIGEKYNNLLDKRLEVTAWERKNYEDQIKKRDEEQSLKITLLKMDFALKNQQLQKNGIAPFIPPWENTSNKNTPNN